MELQRDGSPNYSELADRLGLSPKTVANRVEGLINSKIIAIRAQPNPYKLGLSASALIAIKADPAKIEYVCERLAGNFYVNLVQTVFGRFDILAIVYFPNWEMLHHFINNKLFSIDGVAQVEFYFIKEVLKRYDRFFEKEDFSNGRLKLKDTDWILIETLAKDGRSNPGELANSLGIHITTVYRKISSLLKGNFIKISGVPNPSRLDYSANAYITLDVEPSEVENISNSLYPCPEVHFILIKNNRSGMIVCVHTKDHESLYEFVKKKIAHLSGLLNTETYIRAMVQKTYYGWLMEEEQGQ